MIPCPALTRNHKRTQGREDSDRDRYGTAVSILCPDRAAMFPLCPVIFQDPYGLARRERTVLIFPRDPVAQGNICPGALVRIQHGPTISCAAPPAFMELIGGNHITLSDIPAVFDAIPSTA